MAQISLTGFVKLNITKMNFTGVVRHLPFGFVPLKVVGGDIALTNVQAAPIDDKNLGEELRRLVFVTLKLFR